MRSLAVTERRVTPGPNDGTGISRLRAIGSTDARTAPADAASCSFLIRDLWRFDDTTRISGPSLRFYREASYRGAHYPIDPTRDSVRGLKAH
jgi:hypothetical protein